MRKKPPPPDLTAEQVRCDLAAVIPLGELKLRRIDELKPYGRNARTHSDKQITVIIASIEQFGFVNPVLIDENDCIVAGHGRVEAARKLGLRDVPTLQIEGLTPDQIRAYRLADNRIAELAGYDEKILAIELQHLTSIEVGFPVEVTGWTPPEIDIKVAALDEDDEAEDPDDMCPDLQAAVTSRLGDLWLLGHHRLLHGSALDEAAYDAVLEGRVVQLVAQDPPWNIPMSHISGSGKTKHRPFVMASGEMSDEEFRGFLRTELRCNALHAAPGAVFQVFIDWRGVEKVITAGVAEDLELIGICVWAKTNGGMGSPWRSAHELIVVFKKPGAAIKDRVNLGKHGRYRTNVWSVPGQNSFGAERMDALKSHPTRKPVQLLTEAIRDVTDRGDVVKDSFLGSGTTLIAAQRSGRVCCALELDGRYVDCAIRRWEQLTGEQAVLAGDGRSFAEIEAERALELDDGEATEASDD